MITIFTIPKPFIGLDDIHQRNAIQSWLAIRPECEIILCGNDQGVAEAAKEYGVVHIPDIPVNEFGTPYLDAAFQRAQQIAKNDLMCYVNADIIFPSTLVGSISSIPFQKFLGVGRRFNLDLDELVDFQNQQSSQEFFNNAKEKATEFIMGASDYFFFRKNGFTDLPPFAVGRPYWDNWMIYTARKMGLPVVDVTMPILAVHQNHGYAHVTDGIGDTWCGPEADANYGFVGNDKYFTLWDCTHMLDKSSRIYETNGERYLRRIIRNIPTLYPKTGIRKKFQSFLVKILMGMYYRRKWIPNLILNLAVSVATKIQGNHPSL